MRTLNPSMPAGVSRKLFSVIEYHEMIRAGILRDDQPIELIRGELVESQRMSTEHAACRDMLNRDFHDIPRARVQVRIWGPLTLSRQDEPQPDVSLLERRRNGYRTENPSADDVLLALEISDRTLEFDRGTKVPLYASSGIVESWIVNLLEVCIEVYRKPSPKGYREKKVYRRGDSVSPLAFPDFLLRVDDVLGPK